jgi:hypothetical protein
VADDEQQASPFAWGLRPGGGADEPAPVPPAAPLDQGHFVATPDQPSLPSHELPTEAYTPPVPSYEQPTEAYTPPAYVADNYTPPPIDASLGGASSALVAQPVGFDGLDATETNALDALFGDENFVEYEPGADPSGNPFQRPGGELVVIPREPRAPLSRLQKTLIGVAGGLVGILVLVGLFFVGTRMAPAFAAPPPPTPAESATPAPVEEVLGPVVPGTYGWNALLGTECLEPFGSEWDAEFTVVDCAEPHTAQLVYRGTFDDSALAAYPGVEELQARMGALCASGDNIDYEAAKAYSDVRISASYAASEQNWIDGQRDYFCFVTRAAGEQFTSNIAMPDRPAPVATAEPED